MVTQVKSPSGTWSIPIRYFLSSSGMLTVLTAEILVRAGRDWDIFSFNYWNSLDSFSTAET